MLEKKVKCKVFYEYLIYLFFFVAAKDFGEHFWSTSKQLIWWGGWSVVF